MNKVIYLIAASLIVLTGCGEKGNNEEALEVKKSAIPKQQLKVLENAKGVEQIMKDAEELRREEID